MAIGMEYEEKHSHESEPEYLLTDIREILLEHLKQHGYKAEVTSDIEGPYYSYYYTGIARVVSSMGCIKVEGKNFDCIQILTRG